MVKTLPVFIIGGGTIGLFLAHELISRKIDVVVVEAGDEQSAVYSASEFANFGHPHNGLSIGRAKGLGGTSNLWGGQLAEFIAPDINNKPLYGQPCWPITWEELQPYYGSVYKKLGFQTPVNDFANTLYKADEDTDSIAFFYTYWLKYPNFKQIFLGELDKSAYCTILKNTTVQCLYFEGPKCSKIAMNTNGTVSFATEFSDIVLTNGTIEICRLLLYSASCSLNPLSSHKAIGKYFQDHLNLKVGRVEKPSKHFFHTFSNKIKSGNKLQPKIRLLTAPDRSEYLGVSGYFSFGSDIGQHLDNFKQFVRAVTGRSHQKISWTAKAKLFLQAVRAIPQVMPLVYRYMKDNRIYVPFNSTVSLCLQTQQISIASSTITIEVNNANEANKLPKLVLNWQIDGREITAIRKFCRLLGEYLEREGLGRLVLEDWVNNTENWTMHATDIYHQAGGVIMGENKYNSVTDSNLKIHDTMNVYACGACVMPTSGYANTGLSSLALAFRLADHLTKHHLNQHA